MDSAAIGAISVKSGQRLIAEGRGRAVVQSRAIAKREQLIVGAASLFDEVGFAASSLSMIEKRSGVSRGAIYFQFKTKDDIAYAVVEEQHSASIQLVEAVAKTGAPALEQIVMICQAMAEQIMTDPVVRGGIRLTMELAFADSPIDPYVGWIHAAADLLHRSQLEGDVADWVVPADTSRAIISAFTGTQVVSHVLDKRIDLPKRVDDLLRPLLLGILTPTRRRRIDRILASRLTARY